MENRPVPRFLKRSTVGFALTLTALAAALGGCATETPNQEAPPRDTATIAFGVDVTGFNELVQPNSAIHTVVSHFALFLPLAEEQADYQDGPPTFEPRLARSWTAAEDGLSMTFALRDDVYWNDGVQTTAEDVRFTWQAQVHPAVAWPFAITKQRIRDVEVVDPFTVTFHFTEVYPLQLFEAVQGVILPKHVWGQVPFEEWREKADWFNDNLVTNGPFTLEAWQPQQRFILKRYDRYFEEGLPKIERVVFEIVPDTTQQLSLLRAGRVDFIELVPYADAKAIDARPDIYLTSYIPRNYFFVG
ncbi:MAG: ABC transporter substrate-binding protein, partial [Acidobacteriota bacterium]